VLKTSRKDIITLVLSASLIVGSVVGSGWAGTKTETQAHEIPARISETISPRKAFTLIQENQNNPDFVIIDFRTRGEFAYGHIENAITVDFLSPTFPDELEKLDKNKTYLIYSAVGYRSRDAQAIMAELGFREVYNIVGGIIQWQAEEFPITQGTPTQIIEGITPKEAFTLIQENQDNPDFVIIDVRTREEFAEGHIENAISIDFLSLTFQDELGKLDKNKTYLVYFSCACGGINRKTLRTMVELGFTEVYNITEGFDAWEADGLPTTKEG
jgi:rhodanese-related sulfurtransferase